MYEQPNIFDVCFSRHKGSPESVDANKRVDKTKGQQEVLTLLSRGAWLTSKEIAALLNKPLNAVSGRLSELRAMGKIEKTGERRCGAAVLRLK